MAVTYKALFFPKRYRHFDAPLSPLKAEHLATNPDLVATHPFLPFIKRTISTPRYNRIEHCVTVKERSVAYASHADAAIYRYYGWLLSGEYEKKLDELNLKQVAVAYRVLPGHKCNIHLAHDAFRFISEHRPCVAIAFDVKGFFDNIDHALLLEAWKRILRVERLPADHFKVYKSLIRWASVDEDKAYQALNQRRAWATNGVRLCSIAEYRSEIRGKGLIIANESDHGIPQGSPMSAVLSNIFMLAFDEKVKEYADSINAFYQRYSDDILLIVPPECQNEVVARLTASIADVKLEIADNKTDVVEFQAVESSLRMPKPFQYLGLSFDGERTFVRPQTLSRYYRRLRAYLHRAKRHARRNPNVSRIYRMKLITRYTHKGGRNFISYTKRCVETTKSRAISRQVRSHFKRAYRWADEMEFRPEE